MSVLDRKLARDILRSGGMLLAVALIIAVGTACMVAMGFAYRNLTAAKDRYYDQCKMADFSIHVKKAPLTELERAASRAVVTQYRTRIRSMAVVDLPGVVKPLSGLVLSLPDDDAPIGASRAGRPTIVNDIVLKRGDYFSPSRDNEVIVNDKFAAEHGLAPGDWIHLLLNNRRQELRVVGTAISAEFVYLLGPGALAPDPKSFGVFYIKRSYAEDVFDFDGAANELIGLLAPQAAANPRPTLERMEEQLESFGVVAATPREDQASNKYLTQEIDGLQSMAVFLPTVFFLVAALVLNVLLSRLIEQHRTIIGTLKALGYDNRVVFWHYAKYGIVVAVVGSSFGVGVGYALATAMTWQYRHFFEFPDLASEFHMPLAVGAVAVSIAFALGGCLRAVRAAVRLAPAAAMRPKPPRQGKHVLLERLVPGFGHLSTAWKSTLRSVARSPFRTGAGVAATSFGAALLVTGFMMADASVYLIDFQFRWIQRSDLDLALRQTRDDAALREASRLPGVDYAEPTFDVAGTFRNASYRYKGAISGLPSDARLTIPRDRQARRVPIPRSGVILTRKLAEILHVDTGDPLRFRPVRGRRHERIIPVVGITDSFLGISVYADIEWLADLMDEHRVVSRISLSTDGDPRNTMALYHAVKRMPAIESVSSRKDQLANLDKHMLDFLWIFIGMVVVFSGVIFFGTVLNASLINLSERRREIAVLVVLGYGPWRVGGLLLRESAIVSTVGTLLGMPLGYLLSCAVSWSYNTEVIRFPVVSTPATWIWTVVLAVAFTLAAHAVVQWIVHHADWLDALQSQE